MSKKEFLQQFVLNMARSGNIIYEERLEEIVKLWVAIEKECNNE